MLEQFFNYFLSGCNECVKLHDAMRASLVPSSLCGDQHLCSLFLVICAIAEDVGSTRELHFDSPIAVVLSRDNMPCHNTKTTR